MLGWFGHTKKAGSSWIQSRWRRLEHLPTSCTLDKRLANHTCLRLAFRGIAAQLRLEYAGNREARARKFINFRPPIFQRGIIAIAAANNRRPRARQISAIEMVNRFQGSFCENWTPQINLGAILWIFLNLLISQQLSCQRGLKPPLLCLLILI